MAYSTDRSASDSEAALNDLASLTTGFESTFASFDSLFAGFGGTPGDTTPTVETTAFLKDKWPRYSDQEVLCDIHEINYVLKEWAVLLDGRFINTDKENEYQLYYPNCTEM